METCQVLHLGEISPGEASLMTHENPALSFAFSLEPVAQKWEYVSFVQEKLPWSWKKQSHTW